jgi:hypothetical protein
MDWESSSRAYYIVPGRDECPSRARREKWLGSPARAALAPLAGERFGSKRTSRMRKSVRTACSVLATFVLAAVLLVHFSVAHATDSRRQPSQVQRAEQAGPRRTWRSATARPSFGAGRGNRGGVLAAVRRAKSRAAARLELKALKPDSARSRWASRRFWRRSRATAGDPDLPPRWPRNPRRRIRGLHHRSTAPLWQALRFPSASASDPAQQVKAVAAGTCGGRQR